MNEIFEKIFEQSRITAEDAIREIEKLARKVKAEKLFAAAFANIAILPTEELSELLHGDIPAKLELLAYHLFPFFGISQETKISPIQIQDCIKQLDRLFQARIMSQSFMDKKEASRQMDSLARSLRINAEIVRGSAYPEQTSEEIISIQGKYEKTFKEKLGVGPTKAQTILHAILESEDKTINDSLENIRKRALEFGVLWEAARNIKPRDRTGDQHNLLRIFKRKKHAQIFGSLIVLNDVAFDLLPVSKERLISEGLELTDGEWISFCNLIGLTKEIRMGLDRPISIRQRPLFILPDGRVLLGDISNALDVLWNKFEEEARREQVFYNRYQSTKSKWLEEKIEKCLSKIFPSNNVYQNLSYPDPDKDSGATTELDLAVHWGPFMVLIEAKAKQFRMESQLVDLGRLRTDIKLNIEDAFEQARRAERYINKADKSEFVERSSGRKLSINRTDIRRIYLMTVSQHHLAGIANQLTMAEGLGLFSDKEFPFSLCAADLDTISELCPGPDVFLHYIERRLEIQLITTELIADELELFGAYLKTRLQASRLWEDRRGPIDFVHLSGFQIDFDKWMQFKRGDIEIQPVIKLEIPEEINKILLELRKHENYEARWIAFSLLSLSDNILKAINQFITEVRAATLTPGLFRSTTYQDGDTVISIVASLDIPATVLRKRVEYGTFIEKYRRKSLKSFGIGIMVQDTSKPFDSATWAEGTWEYDPEIEKNIASEPRKVPALGEKLPKRNDPCYCGSGKKYKKCCLRNK